MNHNSLLKTFFQRSIIWLHTIIIPLYNCYDITFCIWSLHFVYGKNKLSKQTNKQTNKTVIRLAKRSFKTQLKNTFYLIKLKFSEAFGGKIIFWTEVLRYNHYENFAKKANFTLWEILYFPFDIITHWFLPNIPFLQPLKIFSGLSRGHKREH